MRHKSRISFGPGAASLILIVVILSMSVLSMLALMNARNDHRLSSRSLAVIEAGYALSEQAEYRFAELDGVAAACSAIADADETYLLAVRGLLPSGMLLDGRKISWTESDGLRTLNCAVELLPWGGEKRLQWREHRLTAVTEEIWN